MQKQGLTAVYAAAMLRSIFALILAIALWSPAGAAATVSPPDLILTGTLTGADHQTYRELAFRVPARTSQITVAFSYTGQAQKSVIDLGLRDPERFRGWSGGNKSEFSLSEASATASYLPGPLPKGIWHLVLGVPNMRPKAEAGYEARIWFNRSPVRAPDTADLIWLRGDLHMHTAHSDGSCLSSRGQKVACPVFRTLQAATDRGLDFVSVTDHNTTSQAGSLRELAPYFDGLVLIPGREITTFQGHANLFGTEAPLDFRLGSKAVPDFKALADQVQAAGGLLSINHPAMPSGEVCMGCGWSLSPTDYGRVGAMEVVNGGGLAIAGGRADGLFSGIKAWEAALNAGFRLTGIGGSDNHDPGLDPAKPSAIGVPTTVVGARGRDAASILEAISLGHVFIDVDGSRTLGLEVTARSGGQTATMGDVLTLTPGADVAFTVAVPGLKAPQIRFSGPLAQKIQAVSAGGTEEQKFDLDNVSGPGWIRVDVLAPDGRLILIGNPIYLRPAGPSGSAP